MSPLAASGLAQLRLARGTFFSALLEVKNIVSTISTKLYSLLLYHYIVPSPFVQ